MMATNGNKCSKQKLTAKKTSITANITVTVRPQLLELVFIGAGNHNRM